MSTFSTNDVDAHNRLNNEHLESTIVTLCKNTFFVNRNNALFKIDNWHPTLLKMCTIILQTNKLLFFKILIGFFVTIKQHNHLPRMSAASYAFSASEEKAQHTLAATRGSAARPLTSASSSGCSVPGLSAASGMSSHTRPIVQAAVSLR